LLVPFLIVLVAKIAGAIIVYNLLGIQTSGTFWTDPSRVFNWQQNVVFLENANSAARWSYTFVGWDSAWYLTVMTHGYGFSPDSYAFYPGFPFFSLIFNLFFQNPIVSAALCALVFGVLWMPFYQLMAERYVSRYAAFTSVLLFAFSPYVFLFTTVAYSEGLFLFSTVSAWYFFKKGKTALASGIAAISALTRTIGLVLVLPMLIVSIREKGVQRIRRVALSLFPILALVFWSVYCQISANDFLAFFHGSQWSIMYTFRTLLLNGLPQKGVNVFGEIFPVTSTAADWLIPLAVVAALVVPPLLIYKTIKIEKSLAFYALLCYVWTLMVGAFISLPRYFSFLFPLWIPLTAILPMKKKSAILIGGISVVSFVSSLILWINFLNGQFIA
jgi:Gpi18-like mannosyltransferase